MGIQDNNKKLDKLLDSVDREVDLMMQGAKAMNESLNSNVIPVEKTKEQEVIQNTPLSKKEIKQQEKEARAKEKEAKKQQKKEDAAEKKNVKAHKKEIKKWENKKKSQGGYLTKEDEAKQRSTIKRAVIYQNVQQIRKQEAEEIKRENQANKTLSSPTKQDEESLALGESTKKANLDKNNFDSLNEIGQEFSKSYPAINNHIDKFADKLLGRIPSKNEIESFMKEAVNIHPEVTDAQKKAYMEPQFHENTSKILEPSKFAQDVEAAQRDLKILNLQGKDQIVNIACKAFKSVGLGKVSDLLMEKVMSPKGKEAIKNTASYNKNILKEQAKFIGDKMRETLNSVQPKSVPGLTQGPKRER